MFGPLTEVALASLGSRKAGLQDFFWGMGYAQHEGRFYFYEYAKSGKTVAAVWEWPDQWRLSNQIAVILIEPAWSH